MSYLIVKGLKVDKNQKGVFIKAASNNVTPRTFEWSEVPGLSEIYQNKGLEEVEKEILYLYWSGEFQKTNNLYDKSVKYCRNKLPFTWDGVYEKKYTREEVMNGLYEGYQGYKNRKKGKFVLFHKETSNYLKKKTLKYTYFTTLLTKARVFNSYEDAKIFSSEVSSSQFEVVDIS